VGIFWCDNFAQILTSDLVCYVSLRLALKFKRKIRCQASEVKLLLFSMLQLNRCLQKNESKYLLTRGAFQKMFDYNLSPFSNEKNRDLLKK